MFECHSEYFGLKAMSTSHNINRRPILLGGKLKLLAIGYWSGSCDPCSRITKLKISNPLEFFPKCFHWIQQIQGQKYVIKKAQTSHLSCKRPGCYQSASKTHVRYRIFKLSPVYASMTYQIPWICWNHQMKVLFHLGKTPIQQLQT